MQSEISFLLDLMFNFKIPKPARELVQARIKELEASRSTQPFAAPPRPTPGAVMQAPSTQRLLEGAEPHASAPVAPPLMTRIVGGEVNTGAGTKGPRKF